MAKKNKKETKNYFVGDRLSDPAKLVDGAKLRENSKKISDCVTRLYRKPDKGGNPFLFSLSISKSHELAADRKLAEKIHAEQDRRVHATLPVATAGTNGLKFFWHPDFLERITWQELSTVMEHELLHVIFEHHRRLTVGNRRIRMWALDYVVNACIENNHKETHRSGSLWGGNLGVPLLLKTLLDYLDGQDSINHPPGTQFVYSDIACYKRSPESIYAEIVRHWEKSPRRCGECGALSIDPQTGLSKFVPCQNRPHCEHMGNCCPACGCPLDDRQSPYGDGLSSPMDSHLECEVSKQDVVAEILKAAAMTKSIHGTVPSEIEDMLGELQRPTLKATDLIHSQCLRKSAEAGMRNDWSRPRRRWLAAQPGQYLPQRRGNKPRWLALLDTSGSMTDEEIVYGVSQLQVLVGKGTEGFVIPVDARPHWDSLTAVRNLGELKRTKVVGRGGTVFEEFFRDFAKKVGTDFDCLAVLTDGGFSPIPKRLQPRGIPVVWVLTQYSHLYQEGWKPTFGYVAPMRHEKL